MRCQIKLLTSYNSYRKKVSFCYVSSALRISHRPPPHFSLFFLDMKKTCFYCHFIYNSLHRQWSVLPSWKKVFELPADQKTDPGISCSSFITFGLASYTDPYCPALLTQVLQFNVYPWMVTFSPKPACFSQQFQINATDKIHLSHHGMIHHPFSDAMGVEFKQSTVLM